MVILRDAQRLELSIHPQDNCWQATFLSFTPGSLLPTLYLLGNYPSHQEAQEALCKKWHRVFPDDPPLLWHDPPIPPSKYRPIRTRQQEGHMPCC